jgi:hypothetical protein
VQQRWHGWHWRHSSCAAGCRGRPSSGTCARGRLAVLVSAVAGDMQHRVAVVPVEPLESSDTFEPRLWAWASMTVPPVPLRSRQQRVAATTTTARSQHGARTSTPSLSVQSPPWCVCAGRVSKRRAWGAAQAMRTFRKQRSAVRTGWAGAGKGRPASVWPAMSQRSRRGSAAEERLVWQQQQQQQQ